MATTAQVAWAGACYRAGFRASALNTIVAIGSAESSCNPDAANEQGEHSYGAPQINIDFWGALSHILDAGIRAEIIALAGGPLTKAFLLASIDNQARAAWIISRHGTAFDPWTTYTGGAYLPMYASAREAVDLVVAYVNALANPPRTFDTWLIEDVCIPLSRQDFAAADSALRALYRIAGKVYPDA